MSFYTPIIDLEESNPNSNATADPGSESPQSRLHRLGEMAPRHLNTRYTIAAESSVTIRIGHGNQNLAYVTRRHQVSSLISSLLTSASWITSIPSGAKRRCEEPRKRRALRIQESKIPNWIPGIQILERGSVVRLLRCCVIQTHRMLPKWCIRL
jgi:hypothetical protein